MDAAATPTTAPPEPPALASVEHGQIGQNIAAVHDFYTREELRLSTSQRHAEAIGGFVGRPAFLLLILLSASAWVGVNVAFVARGLEPFDEPPFIALQGLIGLASLLTATVVLIKQNRVAKLGEQRAHLDLKVALLIEQKSAKLIDLIEELRRDLPNVRHRDDSGAAVLQQAMNPESVLAALAEEVTSPDGTTSAASARLAPRSG